MEFGGGDIFCKYEDCSYAHLTADGAEDLPQQLRHFALLEGEVPLPVEDAEDDVPEAGDRDAAAQGLGPLAAAEVYEVEPRAAAQEDVGGVGGVCAVAHRVLVHVQREDEVGVATLNSFGGLVEIFLKFYEIFLIICEHQPLPRQPTHLRVHGSVAEGAVKIVAGFFCARRSDFAQVLHGGPRQAAAGPDGWT